MTFGVQTVELLESGAQAMPAQYAEPIKICIEQQKRFQQTKGVTI
jgi:hypothetical protein